MTKRSCIPLKPFCADFNMSGGSRVLLDHLFRLTLATNLIKTKIPRTARLIYNTEK